MRYENFKYFCDFIISLLAIIVISPLIFIIGFIIKLSSPGPVFYTGIRTGKNNKKFKIFKFRTMVVNAEKIGGYSTALDDVRLLKFGKFLRKYKLDELPQLINVIRGDMSIVGPRSQVPYYTDKYNNDEKILLSMRPGLTDLVYICFGNMDDFLGCGDVQKKYEFLVHPKKLKITIEHVKRTGFIFDLRIIIGTFFGILGFKNITKIKLKNLS